MTSLVSRLRLRAFLELDLWSWSRAWRASRVRAAGTRTVLICDLMAVIATQKAQAFFAHALCAAGFEPVVLLPSRSWVAERIYRAVGPTRFIHLDDFVDAALRQKAEVEVSRLMSNETALASLVDTEIDGIRVGRNVLSFALRRLRVGRLDDGNPQHRRIVGEILAQSLVAKYAMQRLLDENRFDLALFCERGYTPAGEIFDMCLAHGIDTIQWLGAPQSDRFLFKRYTTATRMSHPLALDAVTWDAVKRSRWNDADEQRLIDQLRSHYVSGAWFNRQQLQIGKQHVPSDEIRRRLGVAPGRKIAVIFCHILYDATFFFGDSLFADYEAWLVETVRAAIANPNLDWIVKVHPVNVWRSRMDGQPMEQLEAAALRAAFGNLPSHVRLMPADTDINTWSLFETIDYGLTVRGTVGMEMPCFGIPTITAGTGRYSGFGFTVDPQTQEEFRHILLALHERPPLDSETVTRARKYAYGTFFLRPVKIDGVRIDYHANTYNHPALAYNVGHSDPIDRGKMGRLTHWLSGERTADFLDTDQLPSGP